LIHKDTKETLTLVAAIVAVVISLIALGFTGLQWRAANRSANAAVQQLKDAALKSHAEMRPYVSAKSFSIVGDLNKQEPFWAEIEIVNTG
jgi:Tfp pilus assembly protein PilV